jgi:hypothetical protein
MHVRPRRTSDFVGLRPAGRAVLLVALGLVLIGIPASMSVSAQDAEPAVDPCVTQPGDPDATPPPPPVSPEDIAAEAAEAARVEAEQVAFVEERLAAIEAGLGPDPDATPPPPPVSPEDAEEVPCDVSYVPTATLGGASWSGACIDSLAKGPIVFRWKGPTERGVFTLRPSSRSAGAISEVVNGSVASATFTYKGKGRYRIEVTATDDRGAPSSLDVVYQTKGTMKQCVSGTCITSKVDKGEALIPLDVQPHSCSGDPPG